ncbi:MAG: A/G-specific adenine glycosylase [Bacteroidales bacterium]|nr:A/G-specific adenine glycosylase [Bacteroidales bacterium]
MKEVNDRLIEKLEQWYLAHARELPWRKTRDAYCIWVSEIILQQTRVAQGYDYYLRFIERFPCVEALASAHEDEVMKYWQGLGYYSRARNMHAAAKDIVARFGGLFPSNFSDIRSLKGVGDYTAAAIASIAFDMPHAVVDGNVYRALSRLFGVDTPIDTPAGKRYFAELAQTLLDCEKPGLYNQSLMEFGALQCTPGACDCSACPLQDICVAYASQTVSQLPVKQGKIAMKSRYFHYFAISCGGVTWLQRREGKDIWRNLYEYPLIETDENAHFIDIQRSEPYRHLFDGVGDITLVGQPFTCRHVLTHRIIYATFYTVEVANHPSALSHLQPIAQADVEQYAVSRLTELYHEHIEKKNMRE